MKPRLSPKRHAAMTLFEVGMVVAVLLVLAVLFLGRASREYSPETRCVNNLKQVGLAYLIWAGDNNDTFPTGVSVTNGGAMEPAQAGNVTAVFLIMSNELSTPAILYCPEDRIRTAATSFYAPVGTNNISYFVGVDATNNAIPQFLLSGDSHFSFAGLPPLSPGLAAIPTNRPVNWTNQRHTDSRHAGRGIIGLKDGSVLQTDSARLQFLMQETGLATNRLAIP